MANEIEFNKVAPIIAVRDINAALERYRRLGFEVEPYEGPEPYGFVERGGVSMHLSEWAEQDAERTASQMYLYVSDADALHDEWKAADVEGHLVDAHDTPYGLREFAYVDPDGTLHRVGSPLASRAS